MASSFMIHRCLIPRAKFLKERSFSGFPYPPSQKTAWALKKQKTWWLFLYSGECSAFLKTSSKLLFKKNLEAKALKFSRKTSKPSKKGSSGHKTIPTTKN